ncbi:MAG: S9 family peptidase [Anaerohalosphaera sp.]|nr:S9 family peptidase [Anaerohalosphaera sp.]
MRKLTILIALILVVSGCSKNKSPKTVKRPVTNEYHGTTVIDNYQWLEDWQDTEVQAWSNEQNLFARELLDNLPSREQISARVLEIDKATSISYGGLSWCGGRLFAVKYDPDNEQPVVVVMDGPNKPETQRDVINLNNLDPSGSTAMDWYKPSPNGRLVAVSLSTGGSESGDVHVFAVDDGKEVGHAIERVNGGTAGGDMCWSPDSSGIFYTRYPATGEKSEEDMHFFVQVWFHRIGTPASEDIYEVGEDFPRIAEIVLETDLESSRVLATVQYGDSGRFAYYLRDIDSAWKKIANYDDEIAQAIFGPNDTIYMVSRSGASRGKILKLKIGDSLDKAEDVIAESDDETIISAFGGSNIAATANRLYVSYQLGGPSTIYAFDHEGRKLAGPAVMDISRAGSIVKLDGDDILYSNSSYVYPSAWYKFDSESKSTTKTALFTKSPVDMSDVEVVREYATSKDGKTKVPVNIIMPKGTKLDGSNPTLLTGYGGYGISQSPGFMGGQKVWLEQGCIYAIANIRGGGEFGEEWHREGSLTQKQNVFDDFAAVMKHLIEAGYTSPSKLAIKGGSNGGLLMGAMITQHPEMFRCTVSGAGIYDMLRVELSPNGAFNVPEFGTVEIFDQFKALFAYSPYHNVKADTAYPSVMFTAGTNDPRVDPMQSRKMTASLQEATSSKNPVILRVSSNTGHGMGTPRSERIAQKTDGLAFIFNELGVTYKPVSGTLN